jgi:hypothetical protein
MVASQVPAVVGFLDAGWFRFRRPAPRLGSARPAMR